ncbi:vascular endothelial growth factor A-like [Brachionichthys hirsutus]|uniref:vascular endothelial growth factor A-like n=1 Tax=Brachionichthys hirsutus TaxID=412623 RepID=UPI0036048FBC
MQSFIGISLFLLAQLLRRIPAQIIHPAEERGPKVMAFREVWAKSMCQPMEQLVDVEQDYPGEVEYIYMPACVPLWRCSGCCGDEKLECQPTLERNISLKLMRIDHLKSMDHTVLTFVEHRKCECRLRAHQKLFTNKSSSQSIKSSHRRRKHKKTTSSCGK